MSIFDDATFLDASFDTVSGFADQATISEPTRGSYSAPVIMKFDVEVMDGDSNLRTRVNTVEIRKADLADTSMLLERNTEIMIGGVIYYVEDLISQKRLTVTYTVTR